ncbi:MAG: ribosome biogenesis GTP-binding protein YihA/YsxC [Dongiaceae bacterium]
MTEEPAAEEAEAERLAALERGRLLFARECGFVAGVTVATALPPAGLPEVAFAGRSNVGKSSLVNALTGRRTLARVSHTPGRTQQLNFFDLGGRLMLVDLPGYGYAKAAKSKVEHWNRLTEDYLRGRPTLRRLCLLIDSRHGLLAPDRAAMKQLDKAAVSYQLVLTKADKTRGLALAKLTAEMQAEIAGHGAAHPEIIATSSHDEIGIAELRAALAALAAPELP